MKEKKFDGVLKNPIFILFLSLPLTILLLFIFLPALLKYLEKPIEDYYLYITIVSSTSTFISIVITAATAVYVMKNNHNHDIDLTIKNNKNKNEHSSRVVLRYFLRIRKIADGYAANLINTASYQSITTKQILKELDYIIVLLDKCVEQPFIINSNYESFAIVANNKIYTIVRNIEMSLKSTRDYADIDSEMIKINIDRFNMIVNIIEDYAKSLGLIIK